MKKQMNTLLLLRALRMFMITMPIIVIYWQDYGLSMRDIFVLQVIFSVAVVIFEVPSGYFADKYGRTTAIKLGSITSTIGFFLYWFMPGFLGFALAEIMLALGGSFLSGSVEALVNESIAENERKKTNGKWQGRLMTAGNISGAVAAVCAGVIAAKYSIEVVLIIQWVVMALSIPLSYRLTETRHTEESPAPAMLQILKGSLHGNKRLQALNVYAAGLSVGTLCMVWFVQPHWRELGVNILYFGYLWAGLQLLVAISAMYAYRLERLLSFRALFGSFAIAIALLYLAMGLLSHSLWSLLVVPGYWLLRGLNNPILIDYVQREANDEEKATVMSINKLASRLLFSITSPFLGWMVDVWSFTTAFYASAVIFGTVAGFGLILLCRSYSK